MAHPVLFFALLLVAAESPKSKDAKSAPLTVGTRAWVKPLAGRPRHALAMQTLDGYKALLGELESRRIQNPPKGSIQENRLKTRELVFYVCKYTPCLVRALKHIDAQAGARELAQATVTRGPLERETLWFDTLELTTVDPGEVWVRVPNTSGKISSPGLELVVAGEGGESMFAKGALAYDDLVKSLNAEDREGLKELVNERRLTLLENGTRVRVLERIENRFLGKGVPACEVRVLDGPLSGETGVVFESELGAARRQLPDLSSTTRVPHSAAASSKTTSQAAKLLRSGQNLEKAGNAKAAATYYKQVVEEYPDSREAGVARDKLK